VGLLETDLQVDLLGSISWFIHLILSSGLSSGTEICEKSSFLI